MALNFHKLIHVQFRHFLLMLRIKYLKFMYGMHIDDTVRISLKAKLDYTNPKGINIDAGSYIAFGAVILTHDMSRNVSRSVIIGKNCFIGANSIILPGVVLGDCTVVAAGAVVTKSFSGNVIIAGNPAKIIKENVMTTYLGILQE